MRHTLPSSAEALRILAERRTKAVRRAAPPAGRALSRYLKDLETRFGQGPQALHARWPEIVGERLARVSEPVRLVKSRPRLGQAGGATLELRVAGPVAALVLHQSEDILAKVNLLLGAKASATRLRIVQGPVRVAAAPPSVPHRRSDPPLDAHAERELIRSVEGADERLQASLLKLGRAVLKRG